MPILIFKFLFFHIFLHHMEFVINLLGLSHVSSWALSGQMGVYGNFLARLFQLGVEPTHLRHFAQRFLICI